MSEIKIEKRGRKPKSDEIKLIEVLDRYINPEVVANKIMSIIEDSPSDKTRLEAIKLFLYYRFGKPKEVKDITIQNETPIFNIDFESLDE
jgi:hypothetical protein